MVSAKHLLLDNNDNDVHNSATSSCNIEKTTSMDLELELATTTTTKTTTPSTKWNTNAHQQQQRKQKHYQQSNRFFSFTCQPSATQTLLIFFNMLIPVLMLLIATTTLVGGVGMATALPVEDVVGISTTTTTAATVIAAAAGAHVDDDVGVVASSVPAANLTANATILATPKPTEAILPQTDSETLDPAGFKSLLNEDLETGIRNAVKSEIESAEEAAEKKTGLQSLLPEDLEEGIREEVKSEIKTDEDQAENNRSAIKRQIEEEEKEKEKLQESKDITAEEENNMAEIVVDKGLGHVLAEGKLSSEENNMSEIVLDKGGHAPEEHHETVEEEDHLVDNERSNAINANLQEDKSMVVVASNQKNHEQIVEDEEPNSSANELDSETKVLNDAHEVGIEVPKGEEAPLISSETDVSEAKNANKVIKQNEEILTNESHNTEEVHHSHGNEDNESSSHVEESHIKEEENAAEVIDETHRESKFLNSKDTESNGFPKESNSLHTVDESFLESKESHAPEAHVEVTPTSHHPSTAVSHDGEIKTDNGLLSVVLNEDLAPTEEAPNGKTSLYTIEQEMEEAEKHETTLAPELEREEDKHMVIKKQGVETDAQGLVAEENNKSEEIDFAANGKETQTEPAITVELPDEEHDFVPKTGEDDTEGGETVISGHLENGQRNDDDVNSYVAVKEDTESKTIEGTVVNQNNNDVNLRSSLTNEHHHDSSSSSSPLDSDESIIVPSSSSKGSRSILHKQHDEAASAHESISPLNADRTMHDNQADEDATLGIGKALPTVSRGKHGAISQRSSVVIALCSGVAVMFIIISLVIFMISHRRQHGTLDIEMQEQRCGKDNLDEEDAQLKLLEIELPTQNALTGNEETEECL